MRREIGKGITVIALTLAVASMATAETRKSSGKSCYTGKVNVIATSKADVAYTWGLDFVYTSDDGDPKKSSTGKCIGMSGIVAGQKERAPQFCTILTADGSTFMSRSIASADNTVESVYFGGTGALKGISGGAKGAKPEEMNAPKGTFAGCRKMKGEWTIPG